MQIRGEASTYELLGTQCGIHLSHLPQRLAPCYTDESEHLSRKSGGEDARYTNHGYDHEKRKADEEMEQFEALDRHLPKDETILVEQQPNTAYEVAI